jgi:hypothetical protein
VRGDREGLTFHIGLERIDRFLIANSMCEQLDASVRNDARRALIDIIAAAPMLSLDMVTGKSNETPRQA